MELVLVGGEGQHAVADGVARRLVPGDHEQQEVVVVVTLAERHRHREAFRLTSLLTRSVPVPPRRSSREPAAVLEGLERRRAAKREVPVRLALRRVREDVGVVRIGVAEHPVAPGDEHVGVVVRHAQQARQHPDREVGARPRVTKSNSRCARAASSVVAVSPRRKVSYPPRLRGVKSRCSSRRSAAWRTPSVSIMDLRSSSCSASSSSSETAPRSEEKVRSSRSTASTSAWRVSDQKPWFGGGSGFQCTGACWRR